MPSTAISRRALLGAGLALPALAGARAQGSAARVTLKVGLTSSLGSNVRLAAAGQLKDLPYDVEWARFSSSPAALEALNTGAIDITSGGDGNTIAIAARPGRAVAIGAYANSLFHSVIVPKASPIASVADLKGKKVGLVKGAGFEYKLRYLLGDVGLTWNDIVPVFLSPADGLTAFVNGALDAWAIWDPSSATAELRHGARQIAIPARKSYNFHYANVESLKDAGKAEAIRQHIIRDLRAFAWLNQNKSVWVEEQVRVARLDRDVAELVASRIPGGGQWLPLDEEAVAELQRIADLFTESGYIPSKVDVRQAIDPRFNESLGAVFKA